MIVCAGRGEDFSFAKSIGVGLVESSIGLMSLCLKESVKSLVFIGSAGAYDRSIPLLSLCLSQSATQIELSLLQDQSYTPLDNHIESNALQDVPHETISLFASQNILPRSAPATLPPRVIVNSSNYITTDEALAVRFCAANIALENMEFFAVMRVAQELQIPCFGVFCVSNYCDKNAHESFVKHHAKVKETLASPFVRAMIESIETHMRNKPQEKPREN